MPLWVNVRTRLGSAAKLLFQLILLATFLQFFGFPAIERYSKKEVMVVEQRRDTDGMPFPAITITVGTQLEPKLCYKLDDGSIERCITNKSLNSSDLLKGVLIGSNGVSFNLTEDLLTEDSTQYWQGRYYTLTLPALTIRPNAQEDLVYLLLSPQKKFHYQIFLHDPKFFIFSDNPLAFPMEMRLFTIETSNSHCYRLNLIEMKEHNVPSDPCNTDPHFNFWECLKDSVSKKVLPYFLHERLIFLTGWLQHQVGPTKQSTLHKQ